MIDVNNGGTLTSAKNLHFSSFSPEPDTVLLGISLTRSRGTVSQHMGLPTPQRSGSLEKRYLAVFAGHAQGLICH